MKLDLINFWSLAAWPQYANAPALEVEMWKSTLRLHHFRKVLGLCSITEQNFSFTPPKIMYAASVTEEQFIYSVSPWLDGTPHPGEKMETDSALWSSDSWNNC